MGDKIKNNNFWGDAQYMVHWYWSMFLPPILTLFILVTGIMFGVALTIDLFNNVSYVISSILLTCFAVSFYYRVKNRHSSSVYAWLVHPIPWLISIISYIIFIYASYNIGTPWFLFQPAISLLRCFYYAALTWFILSYLFLISPLYKDYDQIPKNTLSKIYKPTTEPYGLIKRTTKVLISHLHYLAFVVIIFTIGLDNQTLTSATYLTIEGGLFAFFLGFALKCGLTNIYHIFLYLPKKTLFNFKIFKIEIEETPENQNEQNGKNKIH